MIEQDQTSRPEVIVHAEEVFDAVAAWSFARVLAASSPGSRVILDFSRCREIYHFGLALLAHALAKSPDVGVVLRGLCQHHDRMLRYLGVEFQVQSVDHGDAAATS